MTAKLHITLFGSPTLTQAGKPITGFVSGKAAALVYYLAATNRVHNRDALAALFWPDAATAVAKKNLRDVLVNLRRLLEPYLESTRNEVSLLQTGSVQVDTLLFAAKLAQAQAEALPAARQSLLSEAIHYYGGEFLHGVNVAEAEGFEEWVRGEREHFRQLALQTLHTLVGDALLRGDHSVGIDYATRLLALEPWAEESHRQLMLLLAQSGQRGAALAQYEVCRRILAEEVGVEPAVETVELYERLLNSDDTLLHNLPDPAQASGFIDRIHEVAEINRLLASADCRLLTLAGLGGVGKTRLTLKVAAANIGRFLDGVYFVPLGALTTADLLIPAIGEALGFIFPGREAPRPQLLNYLHNKNLLLVLDNFEHLLGSPTSPHGSAASALVAEILQRAPGVKLLVTSRERLNLRDEWLFAVIGLPTPAEQATEPVEQYAAVQLFLQCARQSWANFAPATEDLSWIARICQLVEGLPLGIELAATWVQMLTCREIAEEIERNLAFLASPLRDTPPRHRSLRAVFEHSWQLLSVAEQQALATLTSFRGGFRKEAAQAVAGASLLQLAQLMHKSLLRREANGRYTLHELLRQFVSEISGIAPAMVAQHAAYYLTHLAHQEARLETAERRSALEEIGEEIDNVRAAWAWAVAHGRVAELAQAAPSLYTFYMARNWFVEGEAMLQQAATRLTTASSQPAAKVAHAKVSARQALLACQIGQVQLAQQLLQNSLTIATAQGNNAERAFCQLGLATVALRQGDYPGAQAAASASLQHYQQLGNPFGRAQALNSLGDAARILGQYAAATDNLQQALALAQTSQLPQVEADSRRMLGSICWNQGDYAGAQANYEQARQLYSDARVAHRQGEADAFNQLGFVAWSLGDYSAAHHRFQQALHSFRQIGDRQGEGRALDGLGRVAERQANYQDAPRYYEQALQISRAIGDRAGEGITLSNLGFLAYRQGDYATAQLHFTATLHMNATIGHRRWAALALACLGLLAYLRGDHQAAAEQCQQALQIAEEIGDRTMTSYALTHLGYALFGLQRLTDAQPIFARALALRTALDEPDRAAEAAAGLAAVALAQANLVVAQQQVESILPLLATNNLARILLPFQVYAICYQVLTASHDARAQTVLDAAQALLQSRAAAIPDAQRRQAFLDHHRIATTAD